MSKNGFSGGAIMAAFIIGAWVMIMALILGGVNFSESNHLSKATTIDICQQLTNETIVNYNITDDGRLECILQTYDHTNNIIIKSNGDSK